MENGFRGIHPFVVLFYYICVGTLAMYFNHPLFLIIILILMIGVNLTHDRGKTLKKWAPLLLTMSTFFILLNPLFVSRGTTILFYFLDRQVTLEAFIYGIVMALGIVIILTLFVSFNLILNGNKFLYIFSQILPRTAFLLMLSIRFVPLLKSRLNEISDVQRIRGMAVTSGRPKDRVKNGMIMLQILLTWSLEEAVQTADSMKARGYGTGKKTSYILYRMAKRDWVWLLSIFTLLGICIAGGSLGYGKIYIYPELGTLHLYPLDWLLLGSMMILVAFPLFVEGREQLRWKSLK